MLSQDVDQNIRIRGSGSLTKGEKTLEISKTSPTGILAGSIFDYQSHVECKSIVGRSHVYGGVS